MGKKIAYGVGNVVVEPLTPEEEAQQLADAEYATERKVVRDAEKARLNEIKANAFITDIEDQMRGKTLAQVKTIGDNMTAGLNPVLAKFIKYLLAKAAMEVR